MQEELIQKFKDGDKRAGDDFYNANIGLIYLAIRKLNTYSIDKDEKFALVNQAFAKSMDAFNPGKGEFSTYFMRTARGHLGRYLRDFANTIRPPRDEYIKDKKIIPCDSLDKVIFNDGDIDITVKDSIGIEEDFTEVESLEIIESLNERSKYIFILYHLKDYSQERIGKLLGMNQVEVSRSLKKSKESLKSILKEVS